MRVAVTGGTGYVGPALVRELLAEGHDVVVVEHRRPIPVPDHPKLHRAKGDVTDRASLDRAFAGCEAVIHLVAILRESPKEGVTFERIHAEGTRNVVAAAKAAGIRRFLLMSANGVEDRDTPYFATKWRMEEMVKEAAFEWTIFRPSYIAGVADRASDEGASSTRGTDASFDETFADVVDKSPLLPSFAGGRFEIQPIARRNVAQAFARALTRREAIGKTYVLVGPERMTWNEYLRRLAKLRGKRRMLAYAPGPLMVALAKVAGRMFPATADQLKMLMRGSVGDPSPAVKDLGLELGSWEDAVAPLRKGSS